MQPEALITLTTARGKDITAGFEVPGTGPVRWTVAEAGMACATIPQHVYHALLYSYAGDGSCFYSLHDVLEAYGRNMARIEGWHKAAKPYALAAVVLLEESRPSEFRRLPRTEDKRRTMLELAPHTWHRHVSRAYEGLHNCYLGWLATGRDQMTRWLKRR